jgi:hypothetical protein
MRATEPAFPCYYAEPMPKRFLYNPFQLNARYEVTLSKGVSHYSAKPKTKIVQSNVELEWDEGDSEGLEPSMTYIETGCFGAKKPLKQVGSADILIINAHGSRSNVAIGYQSGETLAGYNERREAIHKDKWNMLSDTRLAQMIKMDGLGTNHRMIKLNSCFGAGGGVERNVNPETSFAAAIAAELGRLGYSKIRVGGFPGAHGRKAIGADKRGRLTDAGGTELGLSRGKRMWFGPDGSQIGSGPASILN